MRCSTLTFLGFVLLCFQGVAQTELPTTEPISSEKVSPDSTTWPMFRVRIAGEAILIDTLWSDSLWFWSGPCDQPNLTIRFERSNIFKEVKMPCEFLPYHTDSILLQNAQPSTAIIQDSDLTPNQGAYQISMEISQLELDSIPNLSLEYRCFPLIPEEEFQRWLHHIQAIAFESDKCRAIAAIELQHCLTIDHVVSILDLIPSEDKKLNTLEKLMPHVDRSNELPIGTLFHLQLFREKAEKLIR